MALHLAALLGEVVQCARPCVRKARIQPGDLGAIYLTGGSSALRPSSARWPPAFPEPRWSKATCSAASRTGWRMRRRARCKNMNYLRGYPAELQAQVSSMLEQDKLAAMLLKSMVASHGVRTDTALRLCHGPEEHLPAQLRAAVQSGHDNKLHVIANVLGTTPPCRACRAPNSSPRRNPVWRRCS